MDLKTERMFENLVKINYAEINGKLYCPNCTDIGGEILPLTVLRHEDVSPVKTSVGIEMYGYTDFCCSKCNSVYRAMGTRTKRFLVKKLPVPLSDYEKL